MGETVMAGVQSRIGQEALERQAVSREATKLAVGIGCASMIVIALVVVAAFGSTALFFGSVPTIIFGFCVMALVQWRRMRAWKRERQDIGK